MNRMRIVLAGFVVLISVVITSAYDPPPGELDPNDYMHIHHCYLNGFRYRFAISDQQFEKLPDWTPDTGIHPPITPKVAIDLAKMELDKIKIEGEYFWRFESVNLEPVNTFFPEKKWTYRVIYRYAIRGFSSGVWPTMEYLVTLDGKLVPPHISKHKTP